MNDNCPRFDTAVHDSNPGFLTRKSEALAIETLRHYSYILHLYLTSDSQGHLSHGSFIIIIVVVVIIVTNI